MNSSVAAQNPVLANIYSSSNIYNYDSRDLWIAYGIAAVSALLCVIFGIYAIWRNGATYQNVFSTFLRTTRDQALQNLIDPSDKGAEPLPKDLAAVNIILAEDKYETIQVPQRRSSEADARSSVSRGTEEAEPVRTGQELYDVATGIDDLETAHTGQPELHDVEIEMNDLENHRPTIEQDYDESLTI